MATKAELEAELKAVKLENEELKRGKPTSTSKSVTKVYGAKEYNKLKGKK